MKSLINFIIELNQYILYLGIKIRIRLKPKGTDNDEVLQMSNEFWMVLVNGIWIVNYLMPIMQNRQEMLDTTKFEGWLRIAILFGLKYIFDYCTFYRHKKWKIIVVKFDRFRSKQIKTIYLVIFLYLLVFSFVVVYVRWF